MDLTRLIRDKMMQEHLMFAYRGVVNNENSIPLLTLLEKEMEDSEFGLVAKKRLFIFVLESLQNVSRHTSGVRFAEMSLVTYSKTDDGYTVTTGNAVPESASRWLRDKLEQINGLDIAEIKEIYKQMLESSEFSNKGGAGLGLLEMAKKTGNRIDFDFISIDEHYYYFILSKTVDSSGLGINTGGDEKLFRGKSIAQLERIMAQNNIYMLWCGHISQDIGREVLDLTETKLSAENIDALTRKRVFSILVELLDNVAHYSPGREAEKKFGMPVAMIRMNDNVYILTTGNLILNSDVSLLRDKLDQINNQDTEALTKSYVSSLSGQKLDSDSTGNMGLIEMARKSGNLLDYQFEVLNDLYSYYFITLNVSEKNIR